MTIEVQRRYARGLFKGKRHELPPGTEGIIKIVSRHEASHYTALVIRVLDRDILDLLEYDVLKGEEPKLESQRTLIGEQINQADIHSFTPDLAPPDLAEDIITWKPDTVLPEKSEEA